MTRLSTAQCMSRRDRTRLSSFVTTLLTEMPRRWSGSDRLSACPGLEDFSRKVITALVKSGPAVPSSKTLFSPAAKSDATDFL